MKSKRKIILKNGLNEQVVEITYGNVGGEPTIRVNGEEIKFVEDYRAFDAPIHTIIKEYKDGSGEPLDGDEVDRLVEHLRNKINLQEGNITDEEYLELDSN